MREAVKAWWDGLSGLNQTIIISTVCAVLGILIVGMFAANAFLGTDYTYFLEWLRSWLN